MLNDRDCGALDTSAVLPNYFDRFLAELRGEAAMPLSLADELHPVRIVIRARASAGRH